MRFSKSEIGGFLLSLSVVGVNAERIYTIKNKCPVTIKVYSGGHPRGTIAAGRSITKSFPDNWDGFIYTNANGGTVKGSKTTKAGFYGETDYYYVVKDPKLFNVGISITPKATKTGPFCNVDACDSSKCPDAFGSVPTRFPGPESTAPAKPLFACPGSKVGYTVTFCPSGTFPPPKNAVVLHPSGNPDKCINVRSGVFENGAIVDISDCNDTSAQKWIVNRGESTIQLAGTPFCMDAGFRPVTHVGVKLWTCAKKSAGQTWKYDHDDEISLSGTNMCLDLTDGSVENGNQLQIYPCYYNSTNQLWTSTLA
ncbi:carbohydrate-binding module family 13 protein [Hypholoma sublateritium FD-334 SS-4]|uniref:Carbohydrate-binding module family 13 protein n=1 Tax=Hypholoma sublateritium (strain FD-334 SS-4) TaxID=945553 RepID=A0A0D2PB33_HYPSF|nr:carbohydrate-binding module family 13 protein [Hypholoma sublateritium FD-334 SS-4]